VRPDVTSNRQAGQAGQAGFTLIELLVVIGIMAMLTALSMPAISKFMKGQKLDHGGREVQGAFNEARRAAITQRANHFIFFGHRLTSEGMDTFGIRSYRQGKGWEPQEILLPMGIWPVFTSSSKNTQITTDWNVSPIQGCMLRIQDWTNKMPLSTDPTSDPGGIPFATGQYTISTACPTYEFLNDGTILPINGAVDVPAPTNPDIYDLNLLFNLINPSTPADIILRQDGEQSKMCFMDVDVNTGRVKYRVADTIAQDGSGNNGTTVAPGNP
jgi:prepilin-type N-terminal cleavage/methylation domain-containing protein